MYLTPPLTVFIIARCNVIICAMQYVSRQDFLELLGIESGTFEALQHRGQVALAFGATLPGKPGNFLDLDLVSMAAMFALQGPFGRDTATTIMLRFAAMWTAVMRG